MISRVADCCFWLTRYLERVDALARVLGVHHGLRIDGPVALEERWRPVLLVAGLEEDFPRRLGESSLGDGEAVQHDLTWNRDQPASLHSAVHYARENARTVREVMSLEAWEAINDLWLWMRGSASRRLYARNRSAFYEHLVQATVLFHGVSHATLMHDEPFTFMKLGRAVERVLQTARILDAHGEGLDIHEESPEHAGRWLATLRSCCAYDPFFRSARLPLGGRSVAAFLLFQRAFPRSVLYGLDEARTLLFALRRGDPQGLPRRSRSSLERARGEMLQMSMDDVERRGLHGTLDWVVAATESLCDAIHYDYLDPPLAWLRHCVRAVESVESAPPAHRAA